ncbi:annexin A5-like [Tachypleus tridentatus]|uniref:annexin A5-like n=1 Tax=Tachypleus tridentatus TaxID=6853 RepID=UPI003FCF3FF6
MSYPYGSGYPCQPGSQVPTYPNYPGSQGIQQPPIGFNVTNPLQQGYPSSAGGYPPHVGGTYSPSPGGGYPPQSTGGGYPLSSSAPGYLQPTLQGGYTIPSTGGSYPPHSGLGYPSSIGSSYPSPSSGANYPPSTGSSYPPPSSGAGYPSSSGVAYPPLSGQGFSPSTGSSFLPPSGASYPSSTAGTFSPPPSGEAFPAPPTQGSYLPSSVAVYPPPTGGSYLPPSGASYPSSTGGHLPQTLSYGSGYPPGQQPPANLYSSTTPYPAQPSGGHGALAQSVYPQLFVAAHPSVPSQSPYSSTGGKSSYTVMSQSQQGTVVPARPFDPQADAQTLRKAMKGLGTDEKSIINILARRVNEQRQQIAISYKTQFGKDLVKDLKSELSGRFEDVIMALMTPLSDFLASELHHAISGLGTDEHALIEILCTRSNHDIHQITEAYKKLYRQSLERDLIGDTSGYFRRLLVSMTTGGRDEGPADPVKAKQDAQSLCNAGVNRWGTDESTFNAIMASRSFAHLGLVFFEYQKIAGHSVPQAIEKEFSGDIKQSLLTIARCVENRPAYFAEKLHKSMRGLGTNDRTLIRIVTSRCEIDMVQIKHEYQKLFGKPLEKDISDDTSGDYKRVLIALVGGV